jgi:hypothetical protein
MVNFHKNVAEFIIYDAGFIHLCISINQVQIFFFVIIHRFVPLVSIPFKHNLIIIGVKYSCFVILIVVKDVNTHKINFFVDEIIIYLVLLFHLNAKDAEKLVNLALCVINTNLVFSCFSIC